MPEIPGGFRCDDCRRTYPMSADHWHEVIGYETDRHGAGGTNAIAARRRTGQILCVACKTLRASGMLPGQSRLDV